MRNEATEKSVVRMTGMQVLAMKSIIHSTLWNSFVTRVEGGRSR